MTSTLARITLVCFLFFLFIPHFTFAETKIFIKEYTYQASEDDSRNSSRTLALREVKRLLLEELGAYLESVTEVQNFQLTKDQIVTLTAGIVQTQIMDEKWDGHTYWLKSKITADSGDVIKSIDALRKDRQKTKELENVRKLSDDLLKENALLRKELSTVKGVKKQKVTSDYNRTIKYLNAAEWLEKGHKASNSHSYTDAVTAFSKAIELNPQDTSGYFSRGVVYILWLRNNSKAMADFNKVIKLNPQYADAYHYRGLIYKAQGNHGQAMADFNKAIKLNPQNASAYETRGTAYLEMGNYNRAIDDYNKSIEFDPEFGITYLSRGIAYAELGNYNQAIADYNEAIKIYPNFVIAINNRGLAYAKLDNYNQAITDYNKVIELNPKYENAYFNRGLVYTNLDNYNQAIADFQIAARLGHKEAQQLLLKLGRSW
jgi:tetratricopeptide (TPR) repeat protein